MTSFAPDLSSSLISFETIKEYGATNLVDIFRSREGTKALFLDPGLSKPLALIISARQIKQHDVVDLGFIERPDTRTNCRHCIYVLRPSLDLLTLVAAQIELRKKNAIDPDAHLRYGPTISIYFVPHTSLLCERYLSNMGLTMDPDIFIGEYPLDFIPIDGDILSLEYPSAFSRVFIDHDTTLLYTIARSIIHLQAFFGVVPIIKGYGTASHQVAQLVYRLTKELSLTTKNTQSSSLSQNPSSSESYDSLITLVNGNVDTNSSVSGVVQNQSASTQQQQQQQTRGILSLSSITHSLLNSTMTTPTSAVAGGSAPTEAGTPAPEPLCVVNNYTVPSITQIVLIDRVADLLTPFITQYTYEGLVDEVIGIEHSSIEVENPDYDPKAAANSQPTNAPVSPTQRVTLNNSDALFTEIRDLNYRILGPLLHEKASNIKRVYSQRNEVMSKSLDQVQDYLAKFKLVHKEHMFLQIHIRVGEKIKAYLASRLREKMSDIERSLLEGNPGPCEELINQCIMQIHDVNIVYRLIAMVALSHGTLSKKKTEQLQRDIIQTYGYEELSTILALEKLGIFHSNPAVLSTSSATSAHTSPQITSPLLSLFNKGGWDKLSKAFKLFLPIPNKATLKDPSDINFGFNHGYVPLSIRLVEYASAHKGLTRAEEILSQYQPNIAFEYRQDLPVNLQQRMPIPDSAFFSLLPLSVSEQVTPSVSKKHQQQQQQLLQAQSAKPAPPSFFQSPSASAAGTSEKPGDDASAATASSNKPICLVYFIGGATYSEVSLLRYLSEKPSHKFRYIAVTTKMTNGSRILEEVSHQLSKLGKTY